MAIGANTAGTWAAVNATTQTVTLPTHAAGNILILVAACKAATITSADPTITTPATGWTRIGTFADGTTNSGNGLGSVRQAIFYKIATSGSETNPVVTWGGSQTSTPGIAVANSYSKGAGEVWIAPVAVQAATTNATSISVTMGSNPGITSGDWGLGIHTTRDDSALTVPTWTATSATLAAVTVFPTTPIASGTSDDMAGTACYRSVTSGTASAAPVVTATQAAAETGVTAFVRLRVATAAPQSVTPSTATLTTSLFAPTVTVPNNILVTPTTKALTTSRFAPTVTATNHQRATPTTASLTTARFAPTVSTPVRVTPATASLATARFAPTVSATAHQRVTPSTASLTTSRFAPTVLTPTLVTPATASLSTARFAPTVLTPRLVTPATASLAISTFAPTVSIAAGNISVTPSTASLTTARFAPTVALSDNQRVVPTTASLALTAFAPGVVATDNKRVVPSTLGLALTAFAPNVVASDHKLVTPSTATLSLSTFAPTVAAGVRVTPATASMAMTAFAPDIVLTDNVTVRPPTASLVLATFAPTVTGTVPPPFSGIGGGISSPSGSATIERLGILAGTATSTGQISAEVTEE